MSEPEKLPEWVTEGATAYAYRPGSTTSTNRANKVTIEKITKLHVITGDGAKFRRGNLYGIKRTGSWDVPEILVAPDDYRAVGALRDAQVRRAVTPLQSAISGTNLSGTDAPALLEKVEHVLALAAAARGVLSRIIEQGKSAGGEDSPA